MKEVLEQHLKPLGIPAFYGAMIGHIENKYTIPIGIDAEIDAEIKKVESQVSKQGRKLDDVLALQGMSRTELRKLIKLDKLVGKIVGKDVKVTDKEVADYIQQNKEMLPQDQTEEQLRKTATENLKQTKLNEKVRAWLESIQAKAKVLYFVQY